MKSIAYRFHVAALAALFVFNIQFCAFGQGNLTPPGAPAPTMKTLQQVEPRIPVSNITNITSPGSYYLTANVQGFATSFITISNNNVTLDLNGFHILQGDIGVSVGPGLHNVVIKNGNFDNQGGAGISAYSPVVLDGLSFFGSFGSGAFLSSNSVVRNCSFFNNRGNGLMLGDGALVLNVNCNSNGIGGIVGGNRAEIKDCVVAQNGSTGISVINSCLISDCVAQNNGGTNILASNDLVANHCTANGSRNGSGIAFNYGGVIKGCVADGNNQFGIDCFQRGLVVDCVANANGQSGIRADYVSKVERCTCNQNTFCGIISDAGGLSTILDNSCSENGNSGTNNGAGIRLMNAGGLRIEGNNMVLNYRGLDVQTTRNIILRNTAYANSSTNYSIMVGNSFGPIVNVPSAGDISGTANANHPGANFSY